MGTNMCVVDSRWPKESYVAVFSNRGLPGMKVLPTRFALCVVEVIGFQCCSRRAGKGDEKKETLFLCRSLLYTHQQHAKWYNRSTQTAAETHSSSTHAHYVPHAHEHTVMLAVLFVDHLVGRIACVTQRTKSKVRSPLRLKTCVSVDGGWLARYTLAEDQ